MHKEDFVSFLKSLKSKDWTTKVTNKWTVKDIVAHMVGWEKEDCDVIRKTWKSKTVPWFYKSDDYGKFNKKSVEYYKKYTPARLIKEWERWRARLQAEINKIGKGKLKARSDLFRWLCDDEEKSRKYLTHYEHHYRQLKNVLKKK